MIVKHRRGTTREWQELDLIPEEGELVIEECLGGVFKCKVGNGYPPFSKLPYIDDDTKNSLLKKITENKELTDEALADLSEKLYSKVSQATSDISKEINTKCVAISAAYEEFKGSTIEQLATLSKAFDDFDAETSAEFQEVIAKNNANVTALETKVSEQVSSVASRLNTSISFLPIFPIVTW
jgi:hypothetical protein